MYKHSDYRRTGTLSPVGRKQAEVNYFITYLALVIMIITLVITVAVVVVSPAGASALDRQYQYVGVIGDCRADSATGDIYHKRDSYCVSSYHVSTTAAHAVLDESDTVSTQEQAKEANKQEHDKQAIVVSDTVSIPNNVEHDKPAELGNPGNDKPVGHAGEHCNQGMCENADGNSGEHGRSDND